VKSSAIAPTAPEVDARLIAAAQRLRTCVEIADSLAPMRRLLVDVDEEVRAAMLEAAEVGMSERAIAAQTGMAQPTVNRNLDGRRGNVAPVSPLHERMWSFHRMASALATLTARLRGQPLATMAPTPHHREPSYCVAQAQKDLLSAASALEGAAAATEYAQIQQGTETQPMPTGP
jgi:hypothetical protein